MTDGDRYDRIEERHGHWARRLVELEDEYGILGHLETLVLGVAIGILLVYATNGLERKVVYRFDNESLVLPQPPSKNPGNFDNFLDESSAGGD